MSVDADFLVIGSGIAGLRAAISLADVGRVVILTKADPRESNTGYAQGGIAAAMGGDDSPELHARDTLAAGDGICLPEAVDVLVGEGPRYVRELIEWGATFDRDEQGQPALGREAAHSVRRVLHVRDATGRSIGQVLWQMVSTHPRIEVFGDALALSLSTRSGLCEGAAFLDRDGRAAQVTASRTLVATGGAGHVFRETTNPAIATGDGIAMAFEAGARVTDLEFIQFHPTALNVAGAPRFLLSEALRGEGARLVNQSGEGFVQRYEPAGRSGVARSRRASDRPRSAANRSAGVPDDGASRSRLRAQPFPDDHAGVPASGIRPGDGPDSGQSGGALRDGRDRDRSLRADVDR